MGIDVKRDAVDKRQFDGSALRNQTPGKRYRWSRKDDFQVALHRAHGYEIVDRNEDKVESVLSSGTRMKKATDVDSTIQLGDMILMSTDEENYAARRKEEERIALRREHAVTRGVREELRTLSKNIARQYGYEDRDLSYEERGEGKYSGSAEKSYEQIMAEVESEGGRHGG